MLNTSGDGDLADESNSVPRVTPMGTDDRSASAHLEPTQVVEMIHALIDSMNRGGVSELDVQFADVAIRLRGNAPDLLERQAAQPRRVVSVEDSEPDEPPGHVIIAPMIGTFYSAPSPGEAPFLHVGDSVTTGQTVGIIEAMKIMNEIVADRDGTVLEIMVKNAEPVEYGSPLFRIAQPGADGP